MPMAESLAIGRAAMGETVSQGTFSDRVLVLRSDVEVLCNAAVLQGDSAAAVDRPAVAGNAGARHEIMHRDAERCAASGPRFSPD